MPRRDDYEDRYDEDDDRAHDRRERHEDDYDDRRDRSRRDESEDDYEDRRSLARPKKDECTNASLCHYLGILGIIVPLVIWLVQKDKSRFVDRQGKEAVNFQLTLLIVHLCNIALLFCFIGLVTFPVMWVLALVFCIQGGMAASRGEDYRYPICIRFIK
jgi:uncharacterized Tic20 family protein